MNVRRSCLCMAVSQSPLIVPYVILPVRERQLRPAVSSSS